MKIAILIFDGFDELDVLGIYEPLRMAGLDVQLLTFNGEKEVVSIN